jgi:Zn-dependent protease with chaperone function
LATVPTALLETRYSRALESEADDYAIATMQRNHLSPALLADMLVKLESFYQVQGELKDKSKAEAKPDMKQKNKAKPEDDDVLEGYFSTHPLTKDRIDKLRSAS